MCWNFTRVILIHSYQLLVVSTFFFGKQSLCIFARISNLLLLYVDTVFLKKEKSLSLFSERVRGNSFPNTPHTHTHTPPHTHTQKEQWRNKLRYFMTSKETIYDQRRMKKQGEQEFILRRDGRFDLYWCDIVFEFVLLSLFLHRLLFLCVGSDVRTKWKQLPWHQH